ncbi:hypothetical protein DCS32_01755 [Dokdonia sp. Dokd-P16]|uniref:tetratricopeptide repeat-containing sensor histidine kinase n=1 Tax=Dokdonia sp. Dokd-P16 TaxID=2173169 RepID=UPI000D547325|nr:tetratricopeptide repeat protein [Dokdonia sp. Dokd-P16]AWH72930.1 hypothetical protein DCS32_01755 [Dokdonia sp. Dokd-P16]
MQKSTITTLLVFLVLTLCSIWITPLSAQTPIDSTQHYYRVIAYPQNTEDVTAGINYFKRQLENPKNDKARYNYFSELISLGHLNNGDIFESEKTTINLLKDIPVTDTQTIVRLRNRLGRLHRSLNNLPLALENYQQALAMTTKKEDSITISNNIATIYMERSSYEKAAQVLSPFIKDTDRIEENNTLTTIYDNYGYSITQIGDFKGEALMLEALAINEKGRNITGSFSTNRHLAYYYHQQGKEALAKKHALQAKDIAYSINNPRYKLEALGLAIDIGATANAYVFKKLSDSLYKVQTLQENKYAAQKYEYATFQTQAKESELIAQQEKVNKTRYQFLALFIMVITVGIIIFLSLRHKRKRLEQVYITETKISKRLHDEVANDVYKLISQVQTNTYNESHLLDNLEHIYSRTRDISRENSFIETEESFHTTLRDLLLSYKTPSLNIITKGIDKVDWNQISKVHKTTIYRVLQELITNTNKHSKASIAFVEISKEGKNLHILYKDNGIGGAINSKNGLLNAESRIEALKGTITFESKSKQGFKAQINI